jgi:hypothetical protein
LEIRPSGAMRRHALPSPLRSRRRAVGRRKSMPEEASNFPHNARETTTGATERAYARVFLLRMLTGEEFIYSAMRLSLVGSGNKRKVVKGPPSEVHNFLRL